MDYAKLLASVPVKWHQEFVQFVASGDASKAFLDYLDSDTKMQAAVEQALTAQISAFEVRVSSRARRRRGSPVRPTVASVGAVKVVRKDSRRVRR